MRMLFCTLLMTALASWGCQTDKTLDNKVKEIQDDKIILESGRIIPLPPGMINDQTILFIVRHGEMIKADSIAHLQQLNEKGLAHSQKVAQLFAGLNIESVLAPMSAFATQFGQPTAEAHGTNVYNYNARDYGALLDYIYREKFGHKFVVVGYAHTIPDLLNVLSFGKEYPLIPDGSYDDLFVVFTKKRGDGEIHHLKF